MIRHQREGWKSTGTARVAGLALPQLTFVEYDDDPQSVNLRLPSLEGAALLFPGPAPSPWPSSPPHTLVVLDGTWRQTRRMFGKLPKLHVLPRLALPPPSTDVLRLRQTSFESGRSTLEAVAEALAKFETQAVAQPLFALHDAFVERVLKARGVFDQKKQDFEKSAQMLRLR
jgi:DTW domain-containing protein YfiP